MKTSSNELALIIVTLILFAILSCTLTSCNVTRVVTNESQVYQRGDTAVTITTKTTESYNAKKL